MTLRQEIEQAIDDFAREYKGLSPSSDAWEQYRAMTDRAVTKVCAAIGKAAEGMDLICANCGTEDAGICENHECVERQRKECQSYW